MYYAIEIVFFSFYIKYITNPTTSVKKEVTHKDEVTILLKTVDSLVRMEVSWSVIFNPSVARSGTEVCQV
jgi:hypothetical protein